MPTFFGRRYARHIDNISAAEKLIGVTLLLILAAIVTAFGVHITTGVNTTPSVGQATASIEIQSPFPEPSVANWHAPASVGRFTPDNLYVKINGRADIYLQYHVASLTFGAYTYGDDVYRTIDVYWYDMGEPVNAYGIFQAEAAPGAAPVPIGREGYETGGAVFFCKGSSYVQVMPTSPEPADAGAALQIARQIGERIRGDDEPIWAERVLPPANRVPGSFTYIAQDAFSLGFLSDVFAADYDIDGERMTLFVHRAHDAAAAERLLGQYGAFVKKYGAVSRRGPDAGRHMVAGEVYHQFDVVFAKGRYFAGVNGAKTEEKALKAVSTFFDSLE